MASIAPLLLTLGPLSAYFAAQGALLCSSRPRLVPGSRDYLLMAIGLVALLAYGPVGGVIPGMIFRSPGVYAPLAWLSFLTMTALLCSGPSHRRLLIYNIEPARAHAAVREALTRLPGEFSATLHGFEDRARGRGLLLKSSRRLRTAEVEAFGRHADELIRELSGPLRDRLGRDRPGPSWSVALAWFALALATLGGPIAWRAARPPMLELGPASLTVPAPPDGPRRDADRSGLPIRPSGPVDRGPR